MRSSNGIVVDILSQLIQKCQHVLYISFASDDQYAASVDA